MPHQVLNRLAREHLHIAPLLKNHPRETHEKIEGLYSRLQAKLTPEQADDRHGLGDHFLDTLEMAIRSRSPLASAPKLPELADDLGRVFSEAHQHGHPVSLLAHSIQQDIFEHKMPVAHLHVLIPYVRAFSKLPADSEHRAWPTQVIAAASDAIQHGRVKDPRGLRELLSFTLRVCGPLDSRQARTSTATRRFRVERGNPSVVIAHLLHAHDHLRRTNPRYAFSDVIAHAKAVSKQGHFPSFERLIERAGVSSHT